MAGENFIALEITSQEIKTGVDTVGNQLGGFTGNTDTVKKELQTLKDSVAQLQTKSDKLQSLIEQLMNKGGGLNFKYTEIEVDSKGRKSYQSTNSGIAFFNNKGCDISLSAGKAFMFAENLYFAFFPPNSTITLIKDSNMASYYMTGYFYEFI